MDEKTEELRDIFVDVAGEEMVTESQTEEPGSLVDTDDATVDERLAAAVERMTERYEFDTDLDVDAYVSVVRGFYANDDDGAVAADIGADADTVFAARMDLHLIGEGDTDLPVDLPALRAALATTVPMSARWWPGATPTNRPSSEPSRSRPHRTRPGGSATASRAPSRTC
ncbi:hypothetical protein [Halapricum sp. CBA1109]|uniref:hypothetical protein n=1 Tax=Halapricum sp. CBA1109 TaxID=2668068 RepID=UPI001E548B4C|nr:hypothetical protein [Halapricum sp. CBA1109]